MPRLIHVVDLFKSKNAHDNERKAKAQASWGVIRDQQRIQYAGVYQNSHKRTSESIGDSRNLPFLKDVVENGVEFSTDKDDIIFLTNDDNILHPNLPDALRMHCAIHGVCSAHRREFKQRFPSQPMSPEQLVGISEPHLGRDLVGATREWWQAHWEEIPDLLIGASNWDLCMAALIRKSKGYATTRQNLFERIPCCELPFGLVNHEAHVGAWTLVGPNNPAERHNLECFKQWAKDYAPEITVPI